MDSTFTRRRISDELFLNDRSFLLGFSGYLILSLVVIVPLLYGYCATLYPAYVPIAEKLFHSKTMLENMPDSALIFEPLRLILIYALYFLGRHLAKKAHRLNIKSPTALHKNRLSDFCFYF